MRYDLIIPFKIDINEAKEKYLKYVKSKSMISNYFKDEKNIKEIQKVYVPVWLYDVESDAEMRFKTQNNTEWWHGTSKYLRMDNFEALRKGIIKFENIPICVSSKVESSLLEAVEPFEYSEAVSFEEKINRDCETETQDISSEDALKQLEKRLRSCLDGGELNDLEEQIKTTVNDYWVIVGVADKEFKLKNQVHKSALVPLWIMIFDYKGKEYLTAINGQNGKVEGTFPANKGSEATSVLFKGVFTSVLLFILGMIIKLFVTSLSVGVVAMVAGIIGLVTALLHNKGEVSELQELKSLSVKTYLRLDSFKLVEKRDKFLKTKTYHSVYKMGVEATPKYEFMCSLATIIDNPDRTIEDVYSVFCKFSNQVHFEKINHSNYDYLIYFENGEPNNNRYYIKKEKDRFIYNCHVAKDEQHFTQDN